MLKYRDDNLVGQQTTLSADDNLGGQLTTNSVLWMLKYIDYDIVGQLTMYIICRAPGMEFLGKRAPGMEFLGKRWTKTNFLGKLGNFWEAQFCLATSITFAQPPPGEISSVLHRDWLWDGNFKFCLIFIISIISVHFWLYMMKQDIAMSKCIQKLIKHLYFVHFFWQKKSENVKKYNFLQMISGCDICNLSGC